MSHVINAMGLENLLCHAPPVTEGVFELLKVGTHGINVINVVAQEKLLPNYLIPSL